MQRREVVRLLGGIAIIPAFAHLSLDRLYPQGREAHRRLAEVPPLRIFDPHQYETIAAVAELIIPETDTPGARAAGVVEFIDLMVAEWYTDEERAHFLDGIADLDRRSRAVVGRVFVEAGSPDQVRTLSELEAEWLSLRAAGAESEKHFFHQIKFLTTYGYYTSRVGLEQELRWSPIPGRFDPCLATGVRINGSH